MYQKLKNLISYSRFGLNTKPTETGEFNFLQLRNFSFETNNLITPIDSFVNLTDFQRFQILKKGDILFVTKGNRLFAWCYDNTELRDSVASSLFLVLHPNTNFILPRYLELYFNLPNTIDYIAKNLVGGSVISTIRKEDILELDIFVPSIEKQEQLINISQSFHKQMELLDQLKAKKRTYYNLLINQLL